VESPWYSIGGLQAIMRERRIVIQDSEGHDVLRLGRLADDGLWALVVVDANGQERVRLGQVSSTQFGLRVNDAYGRIVFVVDNAGQRLPWRSMPMGSTGSFTTIALADPVYGTDGVWYVDDYIVASNVRLTWGLSYTAGTFDVRVRAYIASAWITLDEVTGLVAGTTRVVDVALPQNAPGTVVRIQIEGRRTAGVANAGLGVLAHPVNYG